LFQQIAKQGLKVRVNGDVLDITPGMKLDRYKTHDIEIVDRMVIEKHQITKSERKHQHRHASWRKCLMVLDQILRKYVTLVETVPTTGISYQNPEPICFFQLSKRSL
jgi:excinuclease ABC subunit A